MEKGKAKWLCPFFASFFKIRRVFRIIPDKKERLTER
jgi:hypothetical protein